MNPGLVNLKEQAAQGLAFALQVVSGGTGRDDGRCIGVVNGAQNWQGGVALAYGEVVKQATGISAAAGSPAVPIMRTTSASEFAIGVIVDAAGIPSLAQGTILTDGYHPAVLSTGTIAIGDPLYLSATPGRVTATRPSARGANRIGFALTNASGTSTVRMLFDNAPAATGLSHRALLDVPGLQRHSDLIESLVLTAVGLVDTDGNSAVAHVNDRDDTTYLAFSPVSLVTVRWVKADLSSNEKSSAVRLRVGANGTTGPFSVLIKGNTVDDLASATTVGSKSITWTTTPTDHVIPVASTTGYRFWWVDLVNFANDGTSLRIYAWQLHEAAGKALYVVDPSSGLGASLDDALATAGGTSVPYRILSGETYTVPLNKQAPFAMVIDNEGSLVVDGYLVMVT